MSLEIWDSLEVAQHKWASQGRSLSAVIAGSADPTVINCTSAGSDREKLPISRVQTKVLEPVTDLGLSFLVRNAAFGQTPAEGACLINL